MKQFNEKTADSFRPWLNKVLKTQAQPSLKPHRLSVPPCTRRGSCAIRILARLASPWSTSAHVQNTTVMHQLTLLMLWELLRGM